MLKKILILLSVAILPLQGAQYNKKIGVIYDSINPDSLTELFAFYHIYPETLHGKKAFDRAWELINKHRDLPISPLKDILLPKLDIDPFITMVTKQAGDQVPTISDQTLAMIDHISSHLHHNKLKGHTVWKKSEVQELNSPEIDLARALLIYQFGDDKKQEIRSYEAYLDLMALQILSKLPKNPTDLQIIDAISHYIFQDMRFRFPPHSMWAKEVDSYTFLSAVLDSRHGVCLGVSILYLSLAQRLNLSLQIVTPPGHIYVAYKKADGSKINIETTARGVDLPDERYLSINTCKLVERSLKEVIGMNFQNAAATEWHKKKYEEALKLYDIAKIYMPDDPLLDIFMGFNYLFIGNEEEAKKLLSRAKDHPPRDHVYPDTTLIDYLDGKTDGESIKAIYEHVDETRESILKKQDELLKMIEKWPEFREGLFHIAVTYLQLGRSKEGLEWLNKYHDLDNHNPTVEYYLGILCLNRFQFKKACEHIHRCEEILTYRGHHPKALQGLLTQLRTTAPFY